MQHVYCFVCLCCSPRRKMRRSLAGSFQGDILSFCHKNRRIVTTCLAGSKRTFVETSPNPPDSNSSKLLNRCEDVLLGGTMPKQHQHVDWDSRVSSFRSSLRRSLLRLHRVAQRVVLAPPSSSMAAHHNHQHSKQHDRYQRPLSVSASRQWIEEVHRCCDRAAVELLRSRGEGENEVVLQDTDVAASQQHLKFCVVGRMEGLLFSPQQNTHPLVKGTSLYDSLPAWFADSIVSVTTSQPQDQYVPPLEVSKGVMAGVESLEILQRCHLFPYSQDNTSDVNSQDGLLSVVDVERMMHAVELASDASRVTPDLQHPMAASHSTPGPLRPTKRSLEAEVLKGTIEELKQDVDDNGLVITTTEIVQALLLRVFLVACAQLLRDCPFDDKHKPASSSHLSSSFRRLAGWEQVSLVPLKLVDGREGDGRNKLSSVFAQMSISFNCRVFMQYVAFGNCSLGYLTEFARRRRFSALLFPSSPAELTKALWMAYVLHVKRLARRIRIQKDPLLSSVATTATNNNNNIAANDDRGGGELIVSASSSFLLTPAIGLSLLTKLVQEAAAAAGGPEPQGQHHTLSEGRCLDEHCAVVSLWHITVDVIGPLIEKYRRDVPPALARLVVLNAVVPALNAMMEFYASSTNNGVRSGDKEWDEILRSFTSSTTQQSMIASQSSDALTQRRFLVSSFQVVTSELLEGVRGNASSNKTLSERNALAVAYFVLRAMLRLIVRDEDEAATTAFDREFGSATEQTAVRAACLYFSSNDRLNEKRPLTSSSNPQQTPASGSSQHLSRLHFDGSWNCLPALCAAVAFDLQIRTLCQIAIDRESSGLTPQKKKVRAACLYSSEERPNERPLIFSSQPPQQIPASAGSSQHVSRLHFDGSWNCLPALCAAVAIDLRIRTLCQIAIDRESSGLTPLSKNVMFSESNDWKAANAALQNALLWFRKKHCWGAGASPNTLAPFPVVLCAIRQLIVLTSQSNITQQDDDQNYSGVAAVYEFLPSTLLLVDDVAEYLHHVSLHLGAVSPDAVWNTTEGIRLGKEVSSSPPTSRFARPGSTTTSNNGSGRVGFHLLTWCSPLDQKSGVLCNPLLEEAAEGVRDWLDSIATAWAKTQFLESSGGGAAVVVAGCTASLKTVTLLRLIRLGFIPVNAAVELLASRWTISNDATQTALHSFETIWQSLTLELTSVTSNTTSVANKPNLFVDAVVLADLMTSVQLLLSRSLAESDWRLGNNDYFLVKKHVVLVDDVCRYLLTYSWFLISPGDELQLETVVVDPQHSFCRRQRRIEYQRLLVLAAPPLLAGEGNSSAQSVFLPSFDEPTALRVIGAVMQSAMTATSSTTSTGAPASSGVELTVLLHVALILSQQRTLLHSSGPFATKLCVLVERAASCALGIIESPQFQYSSRTVFGAFRPVGSFIAAMRLLNVELQCDGEVLNTTRRALLMIVDRWCGASALQFKTQLLGTQMRIVGIELPVLSDFVQDVVWLTRVLCLPFSSETTTTLVHHQQAEDVVGQRIRVQLMSLLVTCAASCASSDRISSIPYNERDVYVRVVIAALECYVAIRSQHCVVQERLGLRASKGSWQGGEGGREESETATSTTIANPIHHRRAAASSTPEASSTLGSTNPVSLHHVLIRELVHSLTMAISKDIMTRSTATDFLEEQHVFGAVASVLATTRTLASLLSLCSEEHCKVVCSDAELLTVAAAITQLICEMPSILLTAQKHTQANAIDVVSVCVLQLAKLRRATIERTEQISHAIVEDTQLWAAVFTSLQQSLLGLFFRHCHPCLAPLDMVSRTALPQQPLTWFYGKGLENFAQVILQMHHQRNS
ncbi:Hypothetical protein, putative [Bodo saltans]|uniref:Uncharacterized protein n=1 Tax=Bodo saltans TaxID=75058 RepID=A0A0S4JBM3_BODSA|nr:Hypothetical protein, putative [Bodo saltans]|eukprot:CUG87760.1 Hypothetical protein, putative [Bodo saltans]